MSIPATLEAVSRPDSEVVSSSESGPRASVLIIEDDPTLLLTLSYNLRRNGFDVAEASDGDSGLRTARTAPRGEEQDKIDGLELDADDYFVKPFAMRKFV